MPQSPRHTVSAHQTTSRPSRAVFLLAMTTLDTTWRLCVPVIGGVVAGAWLDKLWHTAPLLSLIGIVVGGVIATVLVADQLRRLKR